MQHQQEQIFFLLYLGKVIYTGFNGANGYTIQIQNNNIITSYSHVSPDFILSVGDLVNSGDIISSVGPKFVYNVPNNPYHDSSGNPTNGATTGAHLHLTIKKDGIAVNPLNFFH